VAAVAQEQPHHDGNHYANGDRGAGARAHSRAAACGAA
jgi:hypothetical protein